MEVGGGRDHSLGESAVTMDANDGKIGAAVPLANPASVATAAPNEGLDHDALANFDVHYAGANGAYNASDFMAASVWS